ncbi:Transcriptional regulatory protein OmpR [compost metagenome]
MADIRLTSQEFNLLLAFLNLPRRVLTREQLLAETRLNGEEIFDRSVDVLILRLRRKIEEEPSNPILIKTQRGAGYLFDADVSVMNRARPRW